MPRHKRRAIVHQLGRHQGRLLWVANIIHNPQGYRLAQHPASGIDIRDGHGGPAAHLLPNAGIGTRHGAGHGDGNLCAGRGCCG